MKPHKCTFVGYGELQGVKSYHLYGRDTRKYLVNFNVIFDKKTLLNSKEIEHDDTLHLTNTIDNHNIEFEKLYDEMESLPNISQQQPIIPPLQLVISTQSLPKSSNAPMSPQSSLQNEWQCKWIFFNMLLASKIPLLDYDNSFEVDMSSSTSK